MPFIKGKSGNPRGRPVGARGKKTLAREAAMRAEASAKARAIVYGSLGARDRRGLLRPRRPAKSPPARLPADAVPHDPWTEAAALATLLGVDADKGSGGDRAGRGRNSRLVRRCIVNRCRSLLMRRFRGRGHRCAERGEPRPGRIVNSCKSLLIAQIGPLPGPPPQTGEGGACGADGVLLHRPRPAPLRGAVAHPTSVEWMRRCGGATVSSWPLWRLIISLLSAPR